MQEGWQLEQRIETLRGENATLLNRNNALQAEVDDLKTGHDVIEEKARRELGFVGKDETFFQFIEPDHAK